VLRRVLDSGWTYLVLAALLLVFAASQWVEVRLPTRPRGELADLRALREREKLSVVFVLIDTLRADRVGAHGYARPTTPHLDGLAAEGVRFARVEAQSSWTKSSMASLWTGLHPQRTRVTRFDDALPDEAVLPAERFREAGYRTAGVWRNGWVAPNFGFGQGFEIYLRPAPARTPDRFRRSPGADPLKGTDEDATRAAISFLDSHGREPFFLYLHYMDVHQYAYDDEAARLGFGTSYSDAYDSAIRWVDRNVGALVEALEERDLARRTLLVAAADHGEGFGEHGLEGHARSLYREVTHVPLIVSLPVRLRRGVVVEPMVRNVDVWPTVLELAGLPPLPEGDGRSLVPLIEAAAEGRAAEPPPPAVGYLDRRWGRMEEEPMPLVSLRDDGRVLILGREGKRESLELYDAGADPFEEHDLAAAAPPWRADLESAARAELAAEPPLPPSDPVELDELTRDQLRVLGYMWGGAQAREAQK
jgi:arylsulfatase A-like enzyme